MGKPHINEHEIRVTVMLSCTCLHLLSEGADPNGSIRGIRVVGVRRWETSNDFIQEVVDEIHLGASVSLRPVDVAIEGRVGDIKRRLPDVRELYIQISVKSPTFRLLPRFALWCGPLTVNKVRNRIEVSGGGQKHNQTLAGVDERPESWPATRSQRRRGGRIR